MRMEVMLVGCVWIMTLAAMLMRSWYIIIRSGLLSGQSGVGGCVSVRVLAPSAASGSLDATQRNAHLLT